MVFDSASLICRSAPSACWMFEPRIERRFRARRTLVFAALRSDSETSPPSYSFCDALDIRFSAFASSARLRTLADARAAQRGLLRLDLRAIAVRLDAQQELPAPDDCPSLTGSSMISPETSGAIFTSTSGWIFPVAVTCVMFLRNALSVVTGIGFSFRQQRDGRDGDGEDDGSASRSHHFLERFGALVWSSAIDGLLRQ